MAKEKMAKTNDVVAIARAAYEAYVAKDRAAIERLIADDFHFTSPLDNESTAQPILHVAGPTALGSKISTTSTLLLTATGYSSPMKAAAPKAAASAILKSLRYATAKSSRSKSISDGLFRTKLRRADSCQTATVKSEVIE
jgi:hypothetical protein